MKDRQSSRKRPSDRDKEGQKEDGATELINILLAAWYLTEFIYHFFPS